MSFLQTIVIGFSTVFLVSQGSCTKDTCNDLATFTEMTADVSVIVDDQLALNLDWTSGKVLPKEYFEKIFLYKGFKDKYGVEIENDFDFIDSIEINSNNSLSILLKPSFTQESPDKLDFHFFFPDRGNFIDCVHPGSADEYQLDLFFSFDHSTDSLILDEFKWDETFFAGPF